MAGRNVSVGSDLLRGYKQCAVDRFIVTGEVDDLCMMNSCAAHTLMCVYNEVSMSCNNAVRVSDT